MCIYIGTDKTTLRYAYEDTTTQKQRKTICNTFCSCFPQKGKSQLEADTGGLEGLGRPAARFHVTVPMRVVARAHVCTIQYMCIGRYVLIYLALQAEKSETKETTTD